MESSCEAASLQACAIRAKDLVLASADRRRKWQDVLSDDAVPADHRVSANAAELMDAAECADHRPIADGDVARQSDAVR